jgi:hypothetical protein
VLVGRAHEIAKLATAFDRLPSAGGALLLFAGEPGIGKTRLASEAAEMARERGIATAWGCCWEAGGAPLFWPWREAWQSLGLPFPDAHAVAASAPAEARFELFREVTGALGRASAEQALLLVFEDLHAADSSTLLLLDFVARQLRDLPVLVIGTYRDLEARLHEGNAEAIARLGRSGSVMTLARLDATQVGELVREALPDADERLAGSVFEVTDGNPLFVDEVLRDIRAHGERSGLPLGVREVIRQRLGLLSARAREVLEVCAVLGVELERADVLAITSAGDVLDDAVERGVLVARGDRLRFSHALYREALYFALPLGRRRSLHREAARARGYVRAPLAEIAHHLLEAGPEALGEAIDVVIRAAEHAVESFAFEDAIALLERARASLPGKSDYDRLRCRLSSALGEAKLRSGDAAGRTSCLEAADVARALGDAALLGHAGLAYGSVFVMGGVDPVLVSMLEQALEALPPADSPLRARVMARLAAARQPSPPSERPRDIELGLEAIAMARRVADRRELLGVLHSASGVLYGAADPAVRLPIAREQEALAEELGDTARLLHARVRLALDYLELGDFAAYSTLASTYEAHVANLGPEAAPWRVPLMRSLLALTKDDFAESERLQAEARRIDAGQPRARRAEAFHRFGYLRAAERHAELRAAIPELRSLWLAMPYGSVLADARVASVLARIGDHDELSALLARMPEIAVEEQINCASLADAAWAMADPELAQRLEPQLAYYADRWQFYWFDCEVTDGPTSRGLAYLVAILGRWDEAERLFQRALGSVEAVGRRSLAARLRFEFGDLMVRLGREPSRARELVGRAREDADSLGLAELVALIDRRHPQGDTGLAVSRQQAPRAAFTMTLEGEYYALSGTRGTLRFKASRGMNYLARLVEHPNTELHVLDLVGSSAYPDRGDGGPLVDGAALHAYRARLRALRDELETAEALGNVERAERARDEMESLAAELARTTQKGGRARRGPSVVDRARSAVQRRIKDALDRVAEQDEELGAWLRRSVTTGIYCKFSPGS